MGRLKVIEAFAVEMADTFKQHSSILAIANPDMIGPAHSYCTEEGMEKLADIFNRVPIEERAYVYDVFLSKLTEYGLYYDINNFMGTVH